MKSRIVKFDNGNYAAQVFRGWWFIGIWETIEVSKYKSYLKILLEGFVNENSR